VVACIWVSVDFKSAQNDLKIRLEHYEMQHFGFRKYESNKDLIMPWLNFKRISGAHFLTPDSSAFSDDPSAHFSQRSISQKAQ